MQLNIILGTDIAHWRNDYLQVYSSIYSESNVS